MEPQGQYHLEKMAAVVRDMYEGVDLTEVGQMKKGKKESFLKNLRRNQLNENSDVLFKIFRKGRLHALSCRPSNSPEMITSIYRMLPTTHMSVQLTSRRTSKGERLETLSLHGPENELQSLCDHFPDLLTAMGPGAARYNPLSFEFMFDLLDFYIPRLMSHYNGLA